MWIAAEVPAAALGVWSVEDIAVVQWWQGAVGPELNDDGQEKLGDGDQNDGGGEAIMEESKAEA